MDGEPIALEFHGRVAAAPLARDLPPAEPAARHPAPDSSTQSGNAIVPPPLPSKGRWVRRLLMLALILAAIGAAASYGWTWWSFGRFVETTDDAYVKADTITIGPELGGYVTEVRVKDNQPVQAGDVLARLDDRDYVTRLSQAQAEVAGARAKLATLDARLALQRALIAQAQAQVAAAQAALHFAEQESTRYDALARNGYGTAQRAQGSAAERQQRGAVLAATQANVDAANRQLAVLAAERAQSDADLQKQEALRQQAEIDLSRTTLRAPRAGVIGNLGVRVGQFVQPGRTLMSLVPLQEVYVVANFKETQIGAFRPGMNVTVRSDTFADRPLAGTIDSLAPASGAEFSVLPPENATGNFTKIVQRIPVKIRLAGMSAERVLRPGMSVRVRVPLRAASPPLLQAMRERLARLARTIPWAR